MNIEIIEVGEFQVNCLIISDKDNALVVDPGADHEEISRMLSEKKLSVSGYLLTHGHMDHISGLCGMYKTNPAPIYIHPADLKWAFTDENAMPPFYPPPQKPDKMNIIEVGDGQEIDCAGLGFKVIATPGHTPGGVCYYFPQEKILITGDTLFAGSVGRTDLNGGSARTLGLSLKKISGLPDDTDVYPGHGPQTTIGREKRTNFFLRGA